MYNIHDMCALKPHTMGHDDADGFVYGWTFDLYVCLNLARHSYIGGRAGAVSCTLIFIIYMRIMLFVLWAYDTTTTTMLVAVLWTYPNSWALSYDGNSCDLPPDCVVFFQAYDLWKQLNKITNYIITIMKHNQTTNIFVDKFIISISNISY